MARDNLHMNRAKKRIIAKVDIMKKIQILLFVLIITITMQAKTLSPLPGIFKPEMISIDEDYLYAVEGTSIHIYSLKDYRLLKKFGKEGEGPQEFKVHPYGPPLIVAPTGKELVAFSNGKISYFTKDGKYIRELKAPPMAVFIPVGEGFVANGTTVNANNQRVLTVNLFNRELTKIKELYQSHVIVTQQVFSNLPQDAITYQPFDNKIFILGDTSEGNLTISVFDFKGNKLYTIARKLKKIKITEEYKTDTIEWFKKLPQFRDVLAHLKIDFKTYFPTAQDMVVDHGLIYIITYRKSGNNTECIVMDLKGKELKRLYLPIPSKKPLFSVQPFTFFKRSYFWLEENIDKEQWELHMEKLDL